jgi:DNA-binding MarR family transcriptional regulator
MPSRLTSPTPTRGAVPARALEHLRRVVQAIHSQSAAIETATGLTGPQFWALREVARVKDGMTLGELARRLALHKANAGRLADRLATKRLITRETPPDDRRVVLVRATAAGLRRSELPVSAPPQADLLARLESLPRGEAEEIERSLARLVELLGVEAGEAPPLFEAERGPRRRTARRPRG